MRVKHFKRLLFGGKSGGTAELLWLRPFYRDGALFIIPGQKVQKIVRACTIRLLTLDPACGKPQKK